MAHEPVRSLSIIYVAAWLRSFGIGLLGVVLGVFLFREGYSSTAIGMVIAAGIAGSAAGTVFITFRADRLGRRKTLFIFSLMSAMGVVPLIFHFSLPALLVFAFLGMLNGMGTDRSPAFALEQATIPGLVTDQKRTWALAWYSVVLDASGAFGALAAGLPLLEQRLWGVDLAAAYRTLFIGYAAINVVSAALYLFLSSDVEVARLNLPAGRQSRRIKRDEVDGGTVVGTICHRRIRRRVPDRRTCFLLVLSAVWYCRKPACAAVFYGTRAERTLSSRRGVARKENWLDQDHGFYPLAFQFVPDCFSTHAFGAMGGHTLSAA